jgi:hypothetical protein
LIASSASVAVNGAIIANGGVGGGGAPNCASASGAGGGGAIRVVAPIITGTGTLSAAGGPNPGCPHVGGAGRVRLEAFDNRFTGTAPSDMTRVSPVALFLPTTGPPSLRVTSVAGKAVPPNPTGGFSSADVEINEGGPTVVTIETNGIPMGTEIELHLFSDNGADQIVRSLPLSGATATVTVTFPPGFSRGFPRAVWR